MGKLVSVSFFYLSMWFLTYGSRVCVPAKRWLDEKQCNILIRVNITIITTLLTTLTFWVLPIKPHLMLLPVFMVLNAFIPVGVIFLFHRQRKFTSMADQGSYILAALLTNLGTLGGLWAISCMVNGALPMPS